MKLPANVLPENKSQVANYQKIDNDNWKFYGAFYL
jgi:hypothetical protein